ncbi:MAG: 3-dehydroquinate synthase [Allosphingosinicella sp.]|uniref:3-dehydroquinate synthase n=1 Tax=Allosphingosinicella sp. TaxID=2823234 RepID=UPI00393BFF10
MSDATRIDLVLGERSYPVLVGPGLLAEAGAYLAPFARNGRIAVVTDEAVWSAQGQHLQAGLAGSGIEAVPVIVQQGEEAKSWGGIADLLDRLLALGLGRGDHLVAFGGGVIGDLAGFAAAILKRGCGFVQVPTTLLAQVDSSVGGKTGINTNAGKNMVGAFHQPSLVLIDPDVLDTLPERQLRSGYAEVVKYGLLGDADFFAWCEAEGAVLLAGNAKARKQAICASVAAKAAIVSEDEREQGGRRALLNLGHTFGHALEAEAGFSERLLHGEAVAIGMVLAFRFSAARGLCSVGDADRVAAHLSSAGLPTGFNADAAQLVRHIRQDKKAESGRVPFILVRGIGQAFVVRNVDLEEVEAFLRKERSA